MIEGECREEQLKGAEQARCLRGTNSRQHGEGKFNWELEGKMVKTHSDSGGDVQKSTSRVE